MKCEVCGSNRILEGPAYDPGATTCLDCGSMFNRPEMVVPDSEAIGSQIRDSLPLPTGGFNSPEEAAAHLAKLKEAAKRLGKATEIRVDRPTKPKVVKNIPNSKFELKDEFPVEMVFMAVHCYQRPNESWNTTISTAKGERESRFENVRIMAHSHTFGAACTGTCKEI